MSQLIANYAKAVRQSLDFDRETAVRLAAEAEDHLYEAAARDCAGPTEEAVRRAIRRFGPPTEMAALYTQEIFPARLQAAWRSALMIAVMIAITMWVRRALELTPHLSEHPWITALLFADATGHRVAILLGVLAWLASLRARAYGHILTAADALTAAVAALAVSALASLMIAAAALIHSGVSLTALIPLACALGVCLLLIILLIKIRMIRGYAGLIRPR